MGVVEGGVAWAGLCGRASLLESEKVMQGKAGAAPVILRLEMAWRAS